MPPELEASGHGGVSKIPRKRPLAPLDQRSQVQALVNAKGA